MTRTWVVVLLVGCGPQAGSKIGEGSASTSNPPDESVEELVSRITEVVCRKVDGCGCEVDPSFARDCHQAYSRSFNTSLTRALTMEGRTFSMECFEQRIAAIEALECDEPEAFPFDWETRACPISELPTPDGDCGTPHLGLWPCEASQLCDQGGCPPSECVNTGTMCEEAATILDRGVGEPCAFPTSTGEPVCAEGLVCALDGTCQVGVPLGDPCPAGEAGGLCEDGWCACEEGLPCPSPSGWDGVCVPFLPGGSDCVDSEQCRPGRCELDFDSDPLMGTCRPPIPLICDWEKFGSF
jgi:hypothetical protein